MNYTLQLKKYDGNNLAQRYFQKRADATVT